MPACDHCGQVAAKVTLNNNGRTQLKLCPMCQAEFELKNSDAIRPADLSQLQQPWWRRWWNKLSGQ